MEASLASSINRRDARLIAEQFDLLDRRYMAANDDPWYERTVGDVLMDTGAKSATDRAWFVGHIAAQTPGLYFDGAPADCDWDDLYSHLRAEIAARRALQPPSVRAPEMTVRAGVV